MNDTSFTKADAAKFLYGLIKRQHVAATTDAIEAEASVTGMEAANRYVKEEYDKDCMGIGMGPRLPHDESQIKNQKARASKAREAADAWDKTRDWYLADIAEKYMDAPIEKPCIPAKTV